MNGPFKHTDFFSAKITRIVEKLQLTYLISINQMIYFQKQQLMHKKWHATGFLKNIFFGLKYLRPLMKKRIYFDKNVHYKIQSFWKAIKMDKLLNKYSRFFNQLFYYFQPQEKKILEKTFNASKMGLNIKLNFLKFSSFPALNFIYLTSNNTFPDKNIYFLKI